MGFGWINPLYLGGILLLALPVLIHLVQKRHASGVVFPSLMFLQKIPLRQKRRLVIRHWVLLVLRCLLLLLLVIAFARPFFDDPEAGAGSIQVSQDSIIVIDRSYSLGVADLWQQARQAALDVVAAMRAGDRVGVILFDDEVEVASELSGDAAALRVLIERQGSGLRATRLRSAVEQADRLLAASNAERKRIILISDFRARDEIPRISSDVALQTRRLETAGFVNSGISALSIQTSGRATSEAFDLEVTLANYSDSPLQQQLVIEIDGRELERRELRLEAASTRREVFDQLSVAGDLARGVVRLGDDDLSVDNQAYFVFSTRQRIPVLLIEGSDTRNNQSLYLQNALGLARKPAFGVRRARWEQLQPGDLKNWGAIIVNDAPLPSGALADELREYVAAGGGLIVAVGESVFGNWPGGDDDYLPGSLQRRVDVQPGRVFRILNPDRNTALGGLDFASTSVFSYRDIKPTGNDRVLARLDDGAAFLIERNYRKGKVMLVNTTLDPHWNNFALQPGFLPFLYRSLNYVTTYESHSQGVRVGDVVDVLRHARALAGNDAVVAAAETATLTIEPPTGVEINLGREQPWLKIEQQGFYQVHRATPAEVEVVLAANVDPAEARLRPLDVDEFVEEIRASALPPARDRLTARRSQGQEQRQQLWYAIMSLALILMLLEAFAANWTTVRRGAGA